MRAADPPHPIVNTGIFIIGSYIFFLPTISEWAAGAGFTNATAFIFLVLVGWNFVLELAVNLVFSPTITFLLGYARKRVVSSRTTGQA